jgi:hypothetical protein
MEIFDVISITPLHPDEGSGHNSFASVTAAGVMAVQQCKSIHNSKFHQPLNGEDCSFTRPVMAYRSDCLSHCQARYISKCCGSVMALLSSSTTNRILPHLVYSINLVLHKATFKIFIPHGWRRYDNLCLSGRSAPCSAYNLDSRPTAASLYNSCRTCKTRKSPFATLRSLLTANSLLISSNGNPSRTSKHN